MSFGEHLEELRRRCSSRMLALIVGFIVGLCIGMPLVDYIQEPLRRGSREYYLHRAEAEAACVATRSNKPPGVDVPADLAAAATRW